MMLEQIDLQKGFTIEEHGGIGFEMEISARGGPLTTNRYLLRISTEGVYYRQTGEFHKIKTAVQTSEKVHLYRLAVREDTAVQIYADGKLIATQQADVLVDWRVPARGSVLSWKNGEGDPVGDWSGAYQPTP